MTSLNFTRRALRAACAAGAILAAGPALAQTAAPLASTGNVPTYGPPLVGVCVFSRDAALTSSQAGVAATQQIQQIAQTIQSGLDPERASIASDDKALTAEKPKLTTAAYQKRADALQQRAQTYTQTVQTRSAQVQDTRDKAMSQIAQAVTPLLVASITEHHCSLVLERGGIYGANASMDLTPEVVQKLNAALPTVAVTLSPPPAAPAG